ncbi:MAG: metallophosphoesterase [Elioraea sp.]|nr:metallophosphoesterase [Elioraea sp.]MDW8445095.1 metallophosphoesterase [Acetobacteraceae bacterium]
MALRFLHTADLQIGRAFAFAPPELGPLLAEARLQALDRLAAAARAAGAPRVLIAGDLFDTPRPSDRVLAQTKDRLAHAGDVAWHILPGNHDPHRPGGVWERFAREGLPSNVHLHLAPHPVAVACAPGEPTAWLLPAPLTARRAGEDPTAWMDEAPTPEGAIRIGLGHGSIAGFGGEEGAEANPIAQDRARRAGLAYLALGDWHGRKRIDDRTWYCGTPEPDRFRLDPDGDGMRCVGGEALAVAIDGTAAPPRVQPVAIGRFVWRRCEATLTAADQVVALAERLEALPRPAETLLRLTVQGALTLAGHDLFRDRVARPLGARLAWLDLDEGALAIRPEDDELAAIDLEGVVRRAADRLAAQARDPGDPDREVARAALIALWRLRAHARP